MASIKIHQWSDIASQFNNTLILGNGASIAVDKCFKYESLYECARNENLISTEVQDVFDYTKSTDFELVLSLLWHAYHVNQALQTTDPKTVDAYKQLRQALIQAVRHRHAPYDTARPHLPSIYNFLKDFKSVVSLSYDLVLYWAILEGNSDKGGKLGSWFKDGFVNGTFVSNWNNLRTPFGSQGATLVFYPHGNLAIMRDLAGNVFKTAKEDSSTLLDTILNEWNNGQSLPVFVSEGLSEQKQHSIERRQYLHTVFRDVLPSLTANGAALAIYGWSMKENDDHILRQLCKPIAGPSRVRKVAVSVFTDKGSRPQHKIETECQEIATKLDKVCERHIDVLFYDSASDGCWLYPKANPAPLPGTKP